MFLFQIIGNGEYLFYHTGGICFKKNGSLRDRNRDERQVKTEGIKAG